MIKIFGNIVFVIAPLFQCVNAPSGSKLGGDVGSDWHSENREKIVLKNVIRLVVDDNQKFIAIGNGGHEFKIPSPGIIGDFYE